MCDLMFGVLDVSHKEMDIQTTMKILSFSNSFYLDNKT